MKKIGSLVVPGWMCWKRGEMPGHLVLQLCFAYAQRGAPGYAESEFMQIAQIRTPVPTDIKTTTKRKWMHLFISLQLSFLTILLPCPSTFWPPLSKHVTLGPSINNHTDALSSTPYSLGRRAAALDKVLFIGNGYPVSHLLVPTEGPRRSFLPSFLFTGLHLSTLCLNQLDISPFLCFLRNKFLEL